MADARTVPAPSQDVGDAARPPRSAGRLLLRRMLRHQGLMIGGVMALIIALAAVAAPWIAPYSYQEIDLLNRLAGPSPGHWLGTDELGHDVLTRVLYAGRVSIAVGLAAALATAVLGLTVGGIAGYRGGWFDSSLMRFTDLMLSVPVLPILIILAKYIGGTVWGIILVLASFGWMGTARLVRGEMLKLRRMEYTDAARALGASDGRILLRHLVPNALAPVIVAATLTVGEAILGEAALSFLGVGIQPPVPSWGNMLQNAQDFIWTTPRLAVYPGALIFFTVLCFNFVGDGLRDALDPRQRR